MTEYKGKLLKGLFTRASTVLLNNGTSVEDAISGEVANDFKVGVDIKGYTSANPYTVPSDGYVYLGVAAGANSLGWIQGAVNTPVVAVGGQPGFWSVFVRKGMKVYASGNPVTLSYFELQ